jgi:biotin-(acetyl-CoA carboxylase) ligase
LGGSAVSLRIAAGRANDRDAALDALLARLAEWVARVEDPAGIASAFRERDALHGERIAWSAGETRREGEARGIDDDGALVVFTDTGERVRLDAGEVHLEGR